MLKSRILRLEVSAPRAPRPMWSMMTGETADPFAARDALLLRAQAEPLGPEDAAELARLERAIDLYDMAMAI